MGTGWASGRVWANGAGAGAGAGALLPQLYYHDCSGRIPKRTGLGGGGGGAAWPALVSSRWGSALRVQAEGARRKYKLRGQAARTSCD